MLFGKLLESGGEKEENQLIQLEQQLRNQIEKTKSLINSCKIGNQDGHTFLTNAEGELLFPQFRSQINYNQQFWKTYLNNQLSFSMIKQVSDKTAFIQSQVQKLQALQENYSKLYKLKNRKKNRRLAVEIQKKFTCPYERCYKIYGSDVSLNLHIKLKHNGGNKTDRQKLAQQICRAETRGQPIPEMRLNLPPGYLQEFKRTFVDKPEQPQEQQKI